MDVEEIVALSVKHNVSDLHLCSAWPGTMAHSRANGSCAV